MTESTQPTIADSTTSPSATSATPMSSSAIETSVSKGFIPQRMRDRRASLKKGSLQLACIRLHELHGDSPASWENRMCGDGSDYRQVARMNRVLCDLGMHWKVAELMQPVDASVAACPPPDTVYREAKTDGEEDSAQAEYARAPSVETARVLLRKRAQERAASLANDVEIAELWKVTL
jgi:hypothetical protein